MIRRGDKVKGRQGEKDFAPSPRLRVSSSAFGFSLVELVITVAVMAILTSGVIPLVQVSVKRQKEQQLHEALRQIREAIDQFHREALAGAQMQVPGTTGTTGTTGAGGAGGGSGGAIPPTLADPRVRVFITDQTIFTTDNPDRYPPDLDTLKNGVSVLPITVGGLGRRGNQNFTATQAATEDSTIPKTKIYLRSVPIDPMTGKADWVFRSCYDPADSTSWGGENVFDVHSKSEATALNAKKYSDW